MMVRWLAVLLLLPAVAIAQDEGRTISVYGTGYVEGEADRAMVSLALEGTGSSLSEAVEDAQADVAEITEALRSIGLSETAFATSRFSGYDGGRPFLFAKREFKTSIVLTITVDDLDLLDAVVLTLSESPVERIMGITFSLRDLDALRRSAREDALAEAQAKATTMAGQLGLAVGRVLEIEEEPTVRTNPATSYHVDGVRIAEQVVVGYERPRIPGVQNFAQRFAVQAGVRVVYSLVGD